MGTLVLMRGILKKNVGWGGGTPHVAPIMRNADLWALSPTWATPIPYCTFIHKHPQELLLHDLWKGWNCQVADKRIDTTFTIYNFANKLTTISLY